MKNAPARRFHSRHNTLVTSAARAGSPPPSGDTNSLHTRSISFQFHTHFHPYAEALIRRLTKGSVASLQAADTEYLEEARDGTIAILPGSLRAKLKKEEKDVVLGSGGHRDLKAGTVVGVADGTMILAQGFDGVGGELPGRLVRETPRGIKLSQGEAVSKVINFGEEMTLALRANVTLADGTSAFLLEGTKLTLVGCKPKPKLYETIFSATNYEPTELVQKPYPVKDLDFSFNGPYSVYNWELFYHVPITIAISLSKNQRFEEAQRWFHFIFDPTTDSDGPTPERFWKVKPFQYTDVKMIEEILVNLSSGADPALQQETIDSIGAWKDAPFRPHLVARFRQTAYMFKTVMAYLDNLIAWGDSLFRQDTVESINEATQLYVLAANILGPRPQAVPRKRIGPPADLRQDSRRSG